MKALNTTTAPGLVLSVSYLPVTTVLWGVSLKQWTDRFVHAAVDFSTAAAERAPVYCRERQLLQLVALQRVGAEGAGTSRAQVGLHVNHVGSLPLQGDHVKAFPHQVVSRYEGGRNTLTGAPSQAGENRSEAKEEESGGCDGEHGWTWWDNEMGVRTCSGLNKERQTQKCYIRYFTCTKLLQTSRCCLLSRPEPARDRSQRQNPIREWGFL